MRLITFRQDGREGLGVDTPGGVRGYLVGHARYPGPLTTLLRDGADLGMIGRLLLDGAEMERGVLDTLPPVPAPAKILCVGLNYRSHAAETGVEPPDYPTIFARFASTLIGHEAPLVRPAQSRQLDYEGELVAVIGRGGRHIHRREALSHVIGYAAFNDASARDFQFRTSQWTMGKNFDGTGAFGPVLVTADELPPGAGGLRLCTRLNGETVQDARTDELIFDVAALVETLSAAMTLYPGDLIVTGTPAGVAMARRPQRFLVPGDVCEVEIEGIGVLRNPVIQGDEPVPLLPHDVDSETGRRRA